MASNNTIPTIQTNLVSYSTKLNNKKQQSAFFNYNRPTSRSFPNTPYSSVLRPCLLLIDNQHFFLTGLADILSSEFKIVDMVRDDKQAIKLAKTLNPDAIICGLDRPQANYSKKSLLLAQTNSKKKTGKSTLASVHEVQNDSGSIPNLDSIALCKLLKQQLPEIPVIILSRYEDEEQHCRAIEAGAAAFACKRITQDQLLSLVRRVVKGDNLIREDVLQQAYRVSQDAEEYQTSGKKPFSARSTYSLPQMGKAYSFGGIERDEEVNADLAIETQSQFLSSTLTKREIEILKAITKGLRNWEIAIYFNISKQTVKNHISNIFKKLNVSDRTEAMLVSLRKGYIKLDVAEADSNFFRSREYKKASFQEREGKE